MESNEQPKETPVASSQGSIEIQGSILRVNVNLDQPNAMIIAMGILELAKRAVDSYEMRKKASAIVKPSSNGFKSFVNNVMGGRRG